VRDNYWRSYYGFQTTSVLIVPTNIPVPFSIGTKTSGGREEGNDAGKKQDHFHIRFVSLSGGRYAINEDFSMGCNPTVEGWGSLCGNPSPSQKLVGV
jgi:hypothetical protein